MILSFVLLSLVLRSLELPKTTIDVDADDGTRKKMESWKYMIITLSEHSLEAGTMTTRGIYDLRRLGNCKKDEKKRQFGDTPTKDQKKKKRKSE